MKFNQASLFSPYPYQEKFFKAGKFFKQRYMRAGNRVGKTYGAAHEFSYHLTGRYPDGWDGLVMSGSGRVYWCIGIDLDSVSRVLQKELFGTVDVRQDDLLGTGSIPRDCILTDNMIKDGARIRSCFIKHTDGGTNTLMFYGANNEAALMGQAVSGVWIDEEPEFRSIEIYSQCVTRTATTDGFIMLTATPENGQTPLNDLFDNDETGQLYLQSVGWDDAPHLSEETKRNLLAGIPEWQHQMRMNGTPVLGSGAVFPIEDSAIISSPNVADDWHIIAGVDFGIVNDPSVIVYAAWEPHSDVFHLIREDYLDDDRSPAAIASAVLNGPYPNVPVIVPHDGGLNSDAPETKGKLLREYGVNVYGTFRNPLDTKLGMMNITVDSTTVRDISPGLITMNKFFNEGRLKVSTSLTNWFKEKRSYFFKSKQSGGFTYAGPDHCIDASRYAFMSLLDNKGMTVGEARGSIKPIAPIRHIGL